MSAASAFPDQDPYSAPAAYPAPPPQNYRPAPQKYAPRPSYKEEPEYPPQPYEFQYGVSAQEQGTNFKAVENQDAAGNVNGKTLTQRPFMNGDLSLIFLSLKAAMRCSFPTVASRP